MSGAGGEAVGAERAPAVTVVVPAWNSGRCDSTSRKGSSASQAAAVVQVSSRRPGQRSP